MPVDVSLAAKLGYLRDPVAYPDRPDTVETIETHFAWIFLAGRFVYKLKKPIKFQSIDFTALETRRAICELEVNLNRRLAESTYIGAVPLAAVGRELFLEGSGVPIEWLVKMHRLPAKSSLEHRCTGADVSSAQLRRLVTKLARFYRQAARPPWDEHSYVQRLRQALQRYGTSLDMPTLGIDTQKLRHLRSLQTDFLIHRADRLSARAKAGRVVDAHGDLRPEHIFLLAEPQIIDCLEFSSELRWLDSAEEVAFLAIECERLGCPGVGEQITDLYREIAGDPVSCEVVQFYRSVRAMIRALLCAWHLQESRINGQHWLDRANWYLTRARDSMLKTR